MEEESMRLRLSLLVSVREDVNEIEAPKWTKPNDERTEIQQGSIQRIEARGKQEKDPANTNW